MNTSPRSRRSRRLWFVLLSALLIGGGLIAVTLQAEMDRNLKSWAYLALTLLGALLVTFWYLVLSRFSGRARLAVAAFLLVGGIAFSRMVRVDGTVDGSGLPKVVWKWQAGGTKSYSQPTGTPDVKVAELDVPPVPQFFGPNRDGIVTGARLSRDWTANPPKELWRQPIGEGWSAFAVVGGRAWTQEQREGNEMVTCYELRTGRLLWSHKDAVRFTQWQGGTGPRATPTVYEGKVYTYGATGLLNCLDAVTGTKLWSRDVLGENQIPNIEWGISASPLVWENTVVVTGGSSDGPTVLAFDRTTGADKWKAGTSKASYASPLLATLAGRRVVLSMNAGTLTAHHLETGAVLMEHTWGDPRWPKASQPLVLGEDRIFLSAGYGMGCSMLRVKAGEGDRLLVEEDWSNLRMKTQFNSVALRDGFIYGLDDGQLACLDVKTGRRQWKEGRHGSGQSLLVDDLALIQNEPGEVVLVEARPEGGRELGRLAALSSKTWNHPTLAGKYLLVRNSVEAVCYELPVQEGAVAAAASR